MEREKKKINYWIIGGALIILAVIGYYSYLRAEESRNNGVYTVAKIYKIRMARNGWKVKTTLRYRNNDYSYDAMIPWGNFSIGDTYKYSFVKILDYKPNDGFFLIPNVIVPDSLLSSPAEGWSEAWMEEHFPEVVEYVHDTR